MQVLSAELRSKSPSAQARCDARRQGVTEKFLKVFGVCYWMNYITSFLLRKMLGTRYGPVRTQFI